MGVGIDLDGEGTVELGGLRFEGADQGGGTLGEGMEGGEGGADGREGREEGIVGVV